MVTLGAEVKFPTCCTFKDADATGLADLRNRHSQKYWCVALIALR
jgi:hypothetical protein